MVDSRNLFRGFPMEVSMVFNVFSLIFNMFSLQAVVSGLGGVITDLKNMNNPKSIDFGLFIVFDRSQ